jgi:hypothetical protein
MSLSLFVIVGFHKLETVCFSITLQLICLFVMKANFSALYSIFNLYFWAHLCRQYFFVRVVGTYTYCRQYCPRLSGNCASPTLQTARQNTGCSKSHETHGLLGICVSWTPHFKEIVVSTITGLKPPRLLFRGASQGCCVFKSSIHTARAWGQRSAHCGQDINWHIAKRVR